MVGTDASNVVVSVIMVSDYSHFIPLPLKNRLKTGL